MQLNPNGFFVKRYLGIKHEWELPRTVCSLFWLLLFRTGFIALFACGIALMLVVTIDSIVGVVGWLLFSTAVNGAQVGVFTGLLVVTIAICETMWSREIRSAIYERVNFNTPSIRKLNAVEEFIRGIVKRITQKTCTIIEYKSPSENS